MPVKSHTHSYVLYKGNQYKRDDLFKCDDPHCQHFQERAMLMGKASLCPKCKREELILDSEALRRVRPLCFMCANDKKSRELRIIRELVQSVQEGPLENGEPPVPEESEI